MNRALSLAATAALLLSGCATTGETAAAAPDTVVRVDTVVITREVEPPLPDGRATTLCLASGQSIQVRLSPAGDTLVGPRRVPLMALGPAVGFVGDYASDEAWFVHDQPVTFDRREFSRFGQPESRDCNAMKIVGDFDGVNLFADESAAEPFSVLYVPVGPGVFQAYQAQVGRVRG